MFGEALFGDAIGGATAGQTTGEVQPYGLFAQPLSTVDPSSNCEISLAGVGWEEGDDPALSWMSKLPTAELSANFAAALSSFTDILRHQSIITGEMRVPHHEAATVAMHSAVNDVTLDKVSEKPTVSIVALPKIYHMKPVSHYAGEPLGKDLLGRNWVREDLGKSLVKKKEPLPPRDDVAIFNTARDTAELEKNIRLLGCPDALHSRITDVVKSYWDVFAEGGL